MKIVLFIVLFVYVSVWFRSVYFVAVQNNWCVFYLKWSFFTFKLAELRFGRHTWIETPTHTHRQT